MKIKSIIAFIVLALAATLAAAQDAADYRKQGIASLKESQTNPRAIVDAARNFAKAAALFEAQGKEEQVVEVNSYLYWCKKKMTMQDMDAFLAQGEAAVAEKLNAVESKKVDMRDAQECLNCTEAFAKANPDEHLLVAVRYFEVADRFKGTDVSLKAQERSLKELTQAQASPAKNLPPVQLEVKAPTDATGREAVPEVDKQKVVEKKIKELFKEDYLKTKPEEKLALAKKLIQLAADTKDDSTAKYVQLREARDLAIASGDAETAMQAVETIGASYQIDAPAEKIALLSKGGSAVQTKEQAKAFYGWTLKLFDEAIRSEHYDSLQSILTLAGRFAMAAQDSILTGELKAKAALSANIKRDWPAARAALDKLKKTPEDATANLTVGRFYSFVIGDWNRGLPALARSSDASLRKLGEMEVAEVGSAAPVELG